MTTVTGPTDTLFLETLRSPDDGCLAYVVADEAARTALAIDPRLDQVDGVLEILGARDLRLAYVLDTHTHADHLSGVRQLAQRTGDVQVVAHRRGERFFNRRPRGG